jgi:hypothetical protein
MSEFDSDEIVNDEPIVASPDHVKSDITSAIRSYEYGLHITAGVAVNKFGDIALNVMKKELQQMIDKKADESDLTDEKRNSIIPSSIFLKEKFKPFGEFDKLKARLVVKINSFIKRVSHLAMILTLQQ